MASIQYITPRCMGCHRQEIVNLDKEEYDRWQGGEHAQVVWPDLPADQREILISGTHPACWKAMFGDE